MQPAFKEIWLDENDTVAAAQILAWIARPHRPASAIKVLNHWYWIAHRKRGGILPDMPFSLEKPGRLEPSFLKLEADCLMAFRAGSWAQSAILKNTPAPWFKSFSVGIRARAAVHAGEDSAGNAIRDIWSRRRPVAHMCLAAGNAIGRLHREQGWIGFGLAGTMRDTSWVQEAIQQAPQWSRTLAQMPGAVPMHCFRR